MPVKQVQTGTHGLEILKPICTAGPSNGHARATHGSECRPFYSALLGQMAGVSHLLKFVGNHGKSLEDGIGGPSDGHNSLRAIPLRDVDPCPALEREEKPLA